jgi:hypothetical protein
MATRKQMERPVFRTRQKFFKGTEKSETMVASACRASEQKMPHCTEPETGSAMRQKNPALFLNEKARATLGTIWL